jgi:polyphosphate kinase 2 (PPK2 family)
MNINFLLYISMTRERLLDRWHTHTLNCKSCMQAFKNIQVFEKILITLCVIIRKMYFNIFSFVTLAVLQRVKQSFKFIDYQYTEM